MLKHVKRGLDVGLNCQLVRIGMSAASNHYKAGIWRKGAGRTQRFDGGLLIGRTLKHHDRKWGRGRQAFNEGVVVR